MATKKQNANTETNLAVPTGSLSEKVAILSKQLAAVEQITTTVWKAKNTINVGGTSVKIEGNTNKEELVMVLGMLILNEQAYNEGAKRLPGVKLGVYKKEGATVADWEHDIKKQIQIIESEGIRTKLNEMKKRYSDLMDKRDKEAELDREMQEFLDNQGLGE